MKCIYCRSQKTQVTNSRVLHQDRGTWRRRRCLACGLVFTTRETALADNLFVIKKNKQRQRFMYEKLFTSVLSVLNTKKGSDNGTNAKKSKEITETVIRSILREQLGVRDITTQKLIVTVYHELKRQSQALAQHYIYYSEFRLQVGIREKLVILNK